MSAHTESQSLFETSWTLYKKIVDAEYMHHRHFSGIASEALEKISLDAPLKVLDLGCGDGSPMLDLLKSTSVECYTGYDLSEFALHLCQENMHASGITCQLKSGDMAVLISQETETFDLINSSYAVHHLDDNQKAIFFIEVGKRLNPSGRFFYTDVIRHDDQTLDLYRKDYAERVMNWNVLDLSEKILVIQHITSFDFPAFSEDFEQWIKAAGLELEWSIKGDDVHTFYSFKKAG